MPKTTDDLIKEIISKRLWYAPLGWHRNSAAKFTSEFRAGTLSDYRKINALLSLGYRFAQPITWEKIDTSEQPQNFCPSPEKD